MRIKNLRNKRIWRFFCSVKLALILLALIALTSIIGTLIPQGLQPSGYIQKYGRNLYTLFDNLGFFDIYHCWWFVCLLSLFGLNLLICSLDRLRFSRRTAGFTITHFSLILILLGALISALFSQKGFIGLYEGQTKDAFLIRDKPYKLDFKLSLERFSLERYESKVHRITVYIKDKRKKRTYPVSLGDEYRIGGTDYSFVVIRYIPDFFIDQNGAFRSRSELPNNPALLVKIDHPQGTEERWVFARFASHSFAKDENIRFIYSWENRIKDYKSQVKIIEKGKPVLTKIIRVNHPLKYKGYTLYQSTYDSDRLNWTGLQVVKDPGVGWVFVGFVFLNIGLVVTYSVKLKSKRKAGES
jgi:cytochrome c biogenesis protein ResB